MVIIMARIPLIAFIAASLFIAAPGSLRADSTQPATPPSQGPGSGTEPGGIGSSGWTGGTGGSHIGIGNGTGSDSFHSPVATGLDLKGPPMNKGPFPE